MKIKSIFTTAMLLATIMIAGIATVGAFSSQEDACNSACGHAYPPTTINITTDAPSPLIVNPGQTFTINVSWSGGNPAGTTVKWPNNTADNLHFNPVPHPLSTGPIPSGTQITTLTAPTTGNYIIRVFASRGSTATIPRETDFKNISVTVQAPVVPVLTVTANMTTVTVGIPTPVTFTVTSAGLPVPGATVTLSGVATGTGTPTDVNGNVIIIVTATGAGTITATASMTGFTSGTTTLAASALPVLTVAANMTTVTAGVPTPVNFTVRSAGLPVPGATVTLSGVATGTGTPTDVNSNVTIIVTATGAGTITATASMTGFTSGTTTLAASAPPVLTVTANPAIVTINTPTPVTFNVTSAGLPVSGATVTLSGNATGSGTTLANGSVVISVNAIGAGTITATASMTGFTNGTTTLSAIIANITGFTLDTTGKLGKWINASVNITNHDTMPHWFVIDVSGVATDGTPLIGYPLVGTATVWLNASGTANSNLNNIPVLVTIPAGAGTGNYNLIAGIWKLEDFASPDKLITIRGPLTVNVS